MNLTREQKRKIEGIGKKFNLRLILLHGSFARGKNKFGSDLDVAVLGKKTIEFKKLLKIHGDLADVFGDNQEQEIDLKSLHDANPLFRYEVMRHSILLYGKHCDYYSFKAYAFRDFQDSYSLFNLLDKIIAKRQEYLTKVYAR